MFGVVLYVYYRSKSGCTIVRSYKFVDADTAFTWYNIEKLTHDNVLGFEVEYL